MSKKSKEKIRKSKLQNPTKYWKGKNLTETTKQKISEKVKQVMQNPEIRKKISISKKGKVSPRKGAVLSEKTKLKISKSNLGRIHSKKTKEKMKITHKKRWDKIGRKKEKRYIHLCSTSEYKQWRENVFKKDSYICQKCGKGKIYLQAHHIKSWAKYPKLRYNLYNGISLCKECHKKIHFYKEKN